MNRNHILVKARAKINLALDVTGVLPNGYHELSTVLQSLALYDKVYLKKVYKPNYLKIVSNVSWLPNDERNLAYQAARYMIDRFDLDVGIFIELTKVIPSSAGLGGGSADCAAALIGIRNLFGIAMTNEEIREVALRFGADVPFMVMRGTALARGVGEVLTPLPPTPAMHILLVKPPLIVSTEDIFKNFTMEHNYARPDIDKIIHSIKKRDLQGICKGMGNVLEGVTGQRHPIIHEIKDFVMEKGALGAMMTGSGPTVFGIFAGARACNEAAKAAKAKWPGEMEVFVTKPYNCN